VKPSRWCEGDRWPNPRQRMYETSVDVPRRPKIDSRDKREGGVIKRMLN
jgi:hypothetical protein